jgi:hypothetical protein
MRSLVQEMVGNFSKVSLFSVLSVYFLYEAHTKLCIEIKISKLYLDYVYGGRMKLMDPVHKWLFSVCACSWFFHCLH